VKHARCTAKCHARASNLSRGGFRDRAPNYWGWVRAGLVQRALPMGSQVRQRTGRARSQLTSKALGGPTVRVNERAQCPPSVAPPYPLFSARLFSVHRSARTEPPLAREAQPIV